MAVPGSADCRYFSSGSPGGGLCVDRVSVSPPNEDLGEISAIFDAEHRRDEAGEGWRVLTDDTHARKLAAVESLAVSDTPSLVIETVRGGALNRDAGERI